MHHRTSTASTPINPPITEAQMMALVIAAQHFQGDALFARPLFGDPALAFFGSAQQRQLGAQVPHFQNKNLQEV